MEDPLPENKKNESNFDFKLNTPEPIENKELKKARSEYEAALEEFRSINKLLKKASDKLMEADEKLSTIRRERSQNNDVNTSRESDLNHSEECKMVMSAIENALTEFNNLKEKNLETLLEIIVPVLEDQLLPFLDSLGIRLLQPIDRTNLDSEKIEALLGMSPLELDSDSLVWPEYYPTFSMPIRWKSTEETVLDEIEDFDDVSYAEFDSDNLITQLNSLLNDALDVDHYNELVERGYYE